jgi:hypothetical protein
MQIAVETQRNRAIGADQPFPRDRPARQGFENLDQDQVGGFDDDGIVDHRPLMRRRIIGDRWERMGLDLVPGGLSRRRVRGSGRCRWEKPHARDRRGQQES